MTRKISGSKLQRCAKEETNNRKIESEEEEEDDDMPCFVCLGPFSQSKGELIQCTSCNKWAPVSCTDNEDFYIGMYELLF